MLFRYSRLCGTASDAVRRSRLRGDAVKSEIPQGFKLLKLKMSEYIKNIVELTILKI
jgi:hypothetical protein